MLCCTVFQSCHTKLHLLTLPHSTPSLHTPSSLTCFTTHDSFSINTQQLLAQTTLQLNQHSIHIYTHSHSPGHYLPVQPSSVSVDGVDTVGAVSKHNDLLRCPSSLFLRDDLSIQAISKTLPHRNVFYLPKQTPQKELGIAGLMKNSITGLILYPSFNFTRQSFIHSK